MSVCRKLPDGTVQKIAGHTILLDANASEVREGTIGPMTGTNPAVNVTFTDPMPDNDYVVVLECTNYGSWTNAPGPLTITNKTTTGFALRFYCYGGVGSPGLNFKYTAWKPVKIEGYTALQNKVENPDETPTIDSMNLVTSDGVARAIENASAVWKGTKAAWEALPSADKLKYDLAVLLDETLVKAVDREDGTETDVANLNKIFRGTQAEWDALSAAEKDYYDQAEIDDGPGLKPVRLDWNNLENITFTNNSYTVQKTGIVVLSWDGKDLGSGAPPTTVSINGHVVGSARRGSGYTSYGNIQMPVSAGDVITSNTSLSGYIQTAYVVPYTVD